MHLGKQGTIDQYQDVLLEKIRKIKSDPDIKNAVKSSDCTDDKSSYADDSDVYGFTENEEDERLYFESSSRRLYFNKKVWKIIYDISYTFFFIEKTILDEENETNSTNSPFKSIINDIFRDSLIMMGISIDDASRKSTSGILKWFNYLNTYSMPILPVWSNLLLG